MTKDMKTILTRLFTVLMLMMFSMGVSAKVDVELNKEYKGGKVEVKSQEDNPDGSTLVTITVTPDQGFTITHSDKNKGIIVVAVRPTGSQSGTRAPQIAGDLTVTGPTETISYPNSVDYQFTVPAGLNAWVQDIKFQEEDSGAKGTPGVDEPLYTSYSGVYYIASGLTASYNSTDLTQNFYLCPTENWIYYQAPNNYTERDNGQPFLTTYKCQLDNDYDIRKAIWSIVYCKTDNNKDYYYIKHALDGKYLVLSSGAIADAAVNRIRVHLEEITSPKTPDDYALFNIAKPSGKNYLVISPNKASTYYLTLTQGNLNTLQGSTNVQFGNAKNDGPTGHKNDIHGTLGMWTSNTDEGAKFYLIPETKPFTEAPVVINNFDGTITITAASGATIHYTTNGDEPTGNDPSTPNPIILDETITTIKAYAMSSGCFDSRVVTYNIPKCEKPEISLSGSIVTISCSTPGSSIYYTTDADATPTELYDDMPFDLDGAPVVKAIAKSDGYLDSDEAYLYHSVEVTSSSQITNMNGSYLLASNFSFSSSDHIGTEAAPFKGIIDGQLNTISGLKHAFVDYAENAVIKNVILDNVGISGGTNVGAICGEATGDTRIYNCGVLATSSTVTTDDDGYTSITSTSSTISGSGYVGGIVGFLDGSSRVINCFSYADVSGGTHVGGIVGYNNVATTASNLQTMVMNCMFYGEVSGTSIAPIYNGEIITNDGDADGVNNFNYFRLEASYIKNTLIGKVYNCALGAETRFLQRFEFFRYLLNSNRELAAWWATGNADNKEEMMKWVLEPSQIGSSTPYPILKTPGKYASVVNYTPSTTTYDETNRNKGLKLANEGDGGVLHVTIQMSDSKFSAPSSAGFKSGVTGSIDLTITDKDYKHFNFNYGKVQLPYYNDYCDGNYTGNRVVTGWKIVSITVNGTATNTGTGSYSTGDDVTYTNGELTATPYNFADRNSTKKDLYSQSGRVFNQGAYWDVPKGVTAITIEPYWGKAVYLSDAYWDIVYQNGTGSGTKEGTAYDAMTTAANVPNVGGGQRYEYAPSFNSQTVYTSMSGAIASTALFSESVSNPTVYDYAVVLVGNYHHTAAIEANKTYTVTSVDLDGDNEPDYSLMLRFNGRLAFHPVRYDFLNLIGLGMAQKTTGGKGSYNFGIMQPKAWFEVTNTTLFRVTQFEYSKSRTKSPYILQGGVIEQWVTQQDNAGDGVSYFHIGGNVWFKEFHRGSHQDNKDKSTPHPPLSVTGGDFAKFYLTGYYQSQATIYDDNAECYINGGRFGEMAGAGMEGIGTSDGKGNVTWVIDNADIKEFYGGGINFAKPVHGNIHTIISNSHVGVFCGGPKFGDLEDGRTVTTTASNCTFGTYFGAGYGGNSYNRYAPRNHNNIVNFPHNDSSAGNDDSWNAWLGRFYKQNYSSTYYGVSTQFDYQFLPMSSNTENVARIFVEYVGFSLATTHNVTSSLTGCTITGNFYGGGSLGKVVGDVTSTLTNCTVNGNVFGAGYSASTPTVEVMNIGFQTEPYYYEDLGTYRMGVFPTPTTTYHWEHGDAISINKTNHILYTTENLDHSNLGSVEGNVTLTIQTEANKTTTIGTAGNSDTGNVFGGGEQSYVTNTPATDTTSEVVHTVIVNVKGPGTTNILGSVFGGGDNGVVEGSTTVNVED